MHLPIVLFVYNRIDHFKKCIEHLKCNPESKDSELYICSDAPSCNEDISKVAEIRHISSNITGFRKVHLIAHENNIGSLNNLLYSYNLVFQTHDALIALEDDVFVSNLFLGYLNLGLKLYRNDDNIFAICSYMFPVNFFEQNKIVKLPIFNAWGYGITKSKWNSINISFSEIESYINDITAQKFFKKYFSIVNTVMFEFYHQKRLPLDILINYHIFKNKLKCIFPLETYSLNKGHDGTGENCSFDNRFISQNINQTNTISFNEYPKSKKLLLLINKIIYPQRKKTLREISYGFLKKSNLLPYYKYLKYNIFLYKIK